MPRLLHLKSVLLGRKLASSEAHDQLLPKWLALPIFASDPLSSVAYATEEMMLVLALAGSASFGYLKPLGFAVASLLVVVIASYRQTIKAYPNGGGSFIVTNENLGLKAGVVAAAALLTDYVLTVAVSVAAGVAAITSAVPSMRGHRVGLALMFVVLLTVINLRGAKESSKLFAAPTYLFVTTVFVMLFIGFFECMDGVCPKAASSTLVIEPEVGALGLFLILRAFASGSTALTGVEAIADGVQAFREPKSKNAVGTLTAMGAIAISMFLGITTLARLLDVRIAGAHSESGTVISQIGRTIFHGGIGFYLLQIFTAAILVLAANTAYQDFPRLSAILSDHRLMPRQLRNRGDRLVFSNGVLILALLASALLFAFGAEVSRLIQLYVVGVFTSFTLSQAGMVRRWLRTRETGWRRSVVINAIGSLTTGVVLVVVAVVKFSHGAWIVLIAIPLVVMLMLRIRNHYMAVAAQLKEIPVEASTRPNHVIVLVAHPDEATDRALRYAESLPALSLTCLHAEEAGSDDVVYAWQGLHPDQPLVLIPGEGARVSRRVVDFVRRFRQEHSGSVVTVVMSERLRHRSSSDILAHRHGLAIKGRLLFEPHVVVTDLTLIRTRRRKGIAAVPLRRVETVVLVSDLTRPVREALTYAVGMGFPVRAVHVDIDEIQRDRILRHWEGAGYDLELEIVNSPFRSIVEPLLGYLRDRRRNALPGTLINTVIPEFVVPGRITQILHNQTGLAIKGALAAEPGIAVTSVPFHLAHAREASH